MEPSENPQVKGRRDAMLERMKTRYPDREFADDEELFGQINDDYDDYEGQINGYKGREKAFSDMFTKDPRSAAFLTAWRNGEDPVIYLVRQYGEDFLDVLNDPERKEELAKAHQEYLERLAEEKKLEEEYDKNLDETFAALDAVQAEQQLSDEQINEAIAFLRQLASDVFLGKYTPENVRLALNALHHDDDVAAAAHAGEVKGKNTRIRETLRKRQGDGTPVLDGRSNVTREKPRKSMGALDNYGDSMQTIWERGGENRTKRSSL